MRANDAKISLFELFANVHVGCVMTSLNGQDVEGLPFDDVLDTIRFTPSPHRVEFKRYDFSFDKVTGKWLPLAKMREMNTYVEDPLLRIREFFGCVRSGQLELVAAELRAGFNPNSSDLTLTSALHVAVSNGHAEVVRLLVGAGAVVDARDKNMATPLLLCARQGLLLIAQLLLSLGADKSVRFAIQINILNNSAYTDHTHNTSVTACNGVACISQPRAGS
jgi:hypothetical protein